MELQVTETIARVTREEAELRARADLDQLRRRAVEAGRERSRKIFKVTVINATTDEISCNAAGRLLRDWYLHVYINSLRANLSRPTEPIDSQQNEEAAAILTRLRPAEPLQAQKAVDTTRHIAVADADAAAARITERLRDVGAVRAVRHAPEERFDGDQLRVHVTRHWYQRCYDDTVDQAVGARHPLAPVTDGEMLQVARTLVTHEARRVIGRDGIPFLFSPAKPMSDLAQHLADGQPDSPGFPRAIPDGDALDTVSERVRQAWSDMDQEMRSEWLRLADAPTGPAGADWFGVDELQQMKLVQHYVGAHCPELVDAESQLPRIEGAAAEVARKMFDHPWLLIETPATPYREPAPAVLDFEGTSTDTRSRDFSLQSGDHGSAIRQVR